MNKFDAVYKLGKELFLITDNCASFTSYNRGATSQGEFYNVVIKYTKDEVETSFDIDENNNVSNIHTTYKGLLDVDFMNNINFDTYSKLNHKLSQLIKDSGFTYDDAEDLFYTDTCVC